MRADIDGGFAISPGVLSSTEVAGLARELTTLTGARSRAGMRHLLSISSVAALARDPRLIQLARDALGCEPKPFGATLFDKSTDANWLERGGALLMSPLLVHASSKVAASALRRVIHLEYAASMSFDDGMCLRSAKV